MKCNMKINVFLSIISLFVATLIAYLAFDLAKGNPNDVLCGILSGVCFLVTLLPVMGIKVEDLRLQINIRLLAVLFFVVFLISHFCFAVCGVKMPLYVVVNGLILLVFIAIFYKMQSIKKM